MEPASSPLLPREWRFAATTASFVTGDGIVRVLAVPAEEAARISGAQDHVEELYRGLFRLVNRPVERAKLAVAGAFRVPKEPATAATSPLGRTILAYYDESAATPSDRVAAYTRVVHGADRDALVFTSIAVALDLPDEVQHQVLEAIVRASDELATAMAPRCRPPPSMIWCGLLGASDYLKALFDRSGYAAKLTDRLEMIARTKDFDRPSDAAVVDGAEIRPLDLAINDLKTVYDVVKIAFGSSPPSFVAWKQHYAEQPRFAADLSFVAWQGDKPVAAVVLERLADGEGGGDEEVAKIYKTDETLDDATKADGLFQPLALADDYANRQQQIRANATTAYVCGIATLPELRGKRLGPTLLRRAFHAAAVAGLETVVLGTDRHNIAAVRAYVRAGMVETKAVNYGWLTAKLVPMGPIT